MAVKKGITSLDKDLYSLAGSVGLLAGNIALGGFIPFGNLIPIALTSITSGMVLDNYLNNQWEKIFKKNNICNTEGEFPKLLHEFKANNDTETKYIFKMPNKLTPYSLIEVQNILESAMHKPMKISVTKNFYAEVTVFEKASLNYIWYKIFKSCGIKNKLGEYPTFVKAEETKIGLKHIFKLPLGLCLEIIDNISPLIQSAINKPVKLSLTKENELVIQEYQVNYSSYYIPKYNLKYETKNTNQISYIDLFNQKQQELVFPIGITLSTTGEQIVKIDLSDEPNILVAGTNGSGKSNFTKCLLTAMILKDIEIRILDLKFGGDYNVFRNYEKLTVFTKDLDKARNELSKIEKIMDYRYSKLDKNNCKNYTAYNNKFKNDKMKPIVVVIEEYYMLNSKRYKITDILNPILAKGRACNIKFIIVLQRPCKDNLDPVLKANLNHTVGFRAVSTHNSAVILGEGDNRLYTDLKDKGEAIVHDIYQDIQFKSFFLEDDDESNKIKFDLTIEKLIAHKCIEKNEQPIEEEKIETKPIPIEMLKQNKDKKVNLFAK